MRQVGVCGPLSLSMVQTLLIALWSRSNLSQNRLFGTEVCGHPRHLGLIKVLPMKVMKGNLARHCRCEGAPH